MKNHKSTTKAKPRKRDDDDEKPKHARKPAREHHEPKHHRSRAMIPDEETVPAAEPAPAATSTPYEPVPITLEDTMTEQEKGEPDPVSPAEESPGPVETMEQLGIGAKQPYPSKEGG